MNSFRSDLLQILSARGFLKHLTDVTGLDDLLSKKSITLYAGFDPTAPSLHVGSLLLIMLLHWFQKAGHQPIVLIGTATAKIGDPTGRSKERPIQSDATIDAHALSIMENFKPFLSGNTTFLRNDWLAEIPYLQFLSNYGRHFSISRMLSFDSVKQRLQQEEGSLTFLEFNYMLLQAYDFVYLARHHDCELQVGGSDQWGNILNGIELAHKVDKRTLYGMTTPLMVNAQGEKIGKTTGGAIWLSKALLSSYDYWQFWRNVDDNDVGKFLRLFTLLPLDEIERLEKLKGSEINEAKIILATEATRLCHGIEAAHSARETAKSVFEDRQTGASLPTHSLTKNDFLKQPIGLIDILVSLQFSLSKKDGRRSIEEGAVKINDHPQKDPQYTLKIEDFINGSIKISLGKKKHGLVQLIPTE